MALTLEDIQNIRSEVVDYIQIAELSESILTKIGWKCPRVYLSRRTLNHIEEGHGDIVDLDLLQIPLAIKRGLIVHASSKRDFLDISYQPPEGRHRFKCTLRTYGDFEVYVWTFHRSKKRQTKSMMRRGTIIQCHK